MAKKYTKPHSTGYHRTATRVFKTVPVGKKHRKTVRSRTKR